jgi:hypothetical protein
MIQKMVKSLHSKDSEKTPFFVPENFARFCFKIFFGANALLSKPLQTAA